MSHREPGMVSVHIEFLDGSYCIRPLPIWALASFGFKTAKGKPEDGNCEIMYSHHGKRGVPVFKEIPPTR